MSCHHWFCFSRPCLTHISAKTPIYSELSWIWKQNNDEVQSASCRKPWPLELNSRQHGFNIEKKPTTGVMPLRTSMTKQYMGNQTPENCVAPFDNIYRVSTRNHRWHWPHAENRIKRVTFSSSCWCHPELFQQQAVKCFFSNIPIKKC